MLEAGPAFWPSGQGRAAAVLSRDLATAVEALDVPLEELHFQTDSLESAHLALEIERRSYQDLFDGGPDGYLVTDPAGLIVRASARAGEVFACPAADLVGELLTGLIRPEDRPALRATFEGARGAGSGRRMDRGGDPRVRLALPGRADLHCGATRGRFRLPGALGGARHQRPAEGLTGQDARLEGPTLRPAVAEARLVGMTRVGGGASAELLR